MWTLVNADTHAPLCAVSWFKKSVYANHGPSLWKHVRLLRDRVRFLQVGK